MVYIAKDLVAELIADFVWRLEIFGDVAASVVAAVVLLEARVVASIRRRRMLELSSGVWIGGWIGCGGAYENSLQLSLETVHHCFQVLSRGLFGEDHIN